jgi:Tol biopolymer transport system component
VRCRPVVVVLLLSACGRLGFQSTADAELADDAIVDASAIDASLGAFGSPRLLSEIGAANVANSYPSISSDGLELFFSSNRSGTGAIFKSTRSARRDTWSAAIRVVELDAVGNVDFGSRLSADGLQMYFVSNRIGPGLDVYFSSRPTLSSTWAVPVRVTELSDLTVDEYAAAVSSDGKHIFVERNINGGDLMISSRVSGSWTAPVSLPQINGASGHQAGPWLGADANFLVFSSESQLFQATRSTEQSPFVITELTELNSGVYDSDASLTADLRTIVFLRQNGPNYDFYEATR